MKKDPLHTKACELFGIECPIFAFTHCKDVAAAVTNAGGLGVLGVAMKGPEDILQDIRWIRSQVGGKPFGIDLIFPSSIPADIPSMQELKTQIPEEHLRFVQKLKEKYGVPDPKPRDDPRAGYYGSGIFSKEIARQQLEVVLEERVPFLASGLGTPGHLIEAAHSRGIKIGALIGKVRQARREIAAGVDIVIAQGSEAGGHTGDIGTFSLVPACVAVAGDTPVLAAGGVGTGRHLAAALVLGAAGVWIGTLWLASRESDYPLALKQKILAATADDTIRSRCLSGKPLRQLKSWWNEEWESPDAPKPLPMPFQAVFTAEMQTAIEDYALDSLMWTPAGHAVNWVTSLKPCREIIFDLIVEAQEAFEGD